MYKSIIRWVCVRVHVVHSTLFICIIRKHQNRNQTRIISQLVFRLLGEKYSTFMKHFVGLQYTALYRVHTVYNLRQMFGRKCDNIILFSLPFARSQF